MYGDSSQRTYVVSAVSVFNVVSAVNLVSAVNVVNAVNVVSRVSVVSAAPEGGIHEFDMIFCMITCLVFRAAPSFNMTPPISNSKTQVWHWLLEGVPTTVMFTKDSNEVWCNGAVLDAIVSSQYGTLTILFSWCI